MHPRSSFGHQLVRVPTMTRVNCQSRIFWLLRLILLSESCYQSKGFQGNPAGLGLVDTLPRGRSGPQGEVKDTWIFPPQLYHLQCFSQVMHCTNSLYAFQCFCQKRKFPRPSSNCASLTCRMETCGYRCASCRDCVDASPIGRS